MDPAREGNGNKRRHTDITIGTMWHSYETVVRQFLIDNTTDKNGPSAQRSVLPVCVRVCVYMCVVVCVGVCVKVCVVVTKFTAANKHTPRPVPNPRLLCQIWICVCVCVRVSESECVCVCVCLCV